MIKKESAVKTHTEKTSSGSAHSRTSGYKKTSTQKTTGRKSTGSNRSAGTHSNFRQSNTKNRKLSIHKRVNNTKKANITLHIPPAGENVRMIPLGGVEEVGKNMMMIEHKDSIIVIDVGFQFEEETTPGIDYILPNTKYLEERKDKIKAVIITHGHLDHIGGIPYIMNRIGNPPIYTRNLTSLMIKKRQEEFRHLPELNINIVEPGDTISIGDFSINFFPVTHSIPDAMGISVITPLGNIVITGDLKLNHVDEDPTDKEKKTWGEVGKGNNLLFVADSTNVERPGFSITEAQIHKNLEEIIKNVSGRLIVGTFASQFERMLKMIEIADRYNKKIITEGRSIKTNIEIAKKAGLLKIKEGTIIPVEDMGKYPTDKIFVLATGAQGEEFAALMRIANKKHKYIKFTERDTIILSSSVIPGNEISVQRLKDNLYRYNLHLIHYRVSDVHSTGHGNAGELTWINKQVGAKFFMPGYGYHSMLRAHAQTIEESGFPKKNIIVPDNGTIIEFDKKGMKILKEKAPSSIMMVDGFSIGDVQEVVLRDRQMLAQDGMFVIIAIVDLKTGKLRKSPDIISRGFVYLRESQELLREARFVIKKTVEGTLVGMHPINFDDVKNKVTDDLSRFLLRKTDKRPIVIPVMIGV
jgi:ribonuclease J